MPTYIDPSTQTPLFTAQQVTCAYPISDTYGTIPRILYYSLLVGCLLIRWHPWLSDAFLGAAATYAGVAAIEAFILLANWPRIPSEEEIIIPYISPSSVAGNSTLMGLRNLVTDRHLLPVQPGVMEFDVDAILAIVVTGYLFMLPVHCWSTHVRGNRARHLLIGMWNILMLCATVCSLIMWMRISNVPLQFRFCYPDYPDLESVTNDGWISSLWQGNWNSTIWTTFADPAAANTLTENCIYPCFNTTQILRRQNSIVATLVTNNSPRTDYDLPESAWSHLLRLVYFMYAAIAVSACTAIVVLVMTATHLDRLIKIPLHQPILIWYDRANIKSRIASDLRNLFRGSPRHRKTSNKSLPNDGTSIPLSTPTSSPSSAGGRVDPMVDLPPSRLRSALHLFANFIAFVLLFVVVLVIPATWIVFIVWIEWWIRRDIVGSDTPRQVGQWAPAVSVCLVLVSAMVLRSKYVIASRQEVEREIQALKLRLRALEALKEKKME